MHSHWLLFILGQQSLASKTELSLAQLLLDRKLKVIAVPGGGFCLLHAVRTVLNNDECFDTTTADIAEQVRSEVRRNLPHYEPFFRHLAQVQQV
jgi:hypothetical protein